MSGRISLDTFEIAHPCTARWEEMTGNDEVRFCGACRLFVYNLSAMTRRKAEGFLAARQGRTCTLLYRRADGTVLTRDCPVGLRAARRRAAHALGAAAAVLLACLGFVRGVARDTGVLPEPLRPVGGKSPAEAGLAWLRGHEPFKTVIDWLDPPPPPLPAPPPDILGPGW
jgi:hypothetical protein